MLLIAAKIIELPANCLFGILWSCLELKLVSQFRCGYNQNLFALHAKKDFGCNHNEIVQTNF